DRRKPPARNTLFRWVREQVASGVLRPMTRGLYLRAINEAKLRRSDNPASNIVRNLPKRKARDVVLSFNEARIVWQAAESTGYPFGTHMQLLLLTACRCDEWAS